MLCICLGHLRRMLCICLGYLRLEGALALVEPRDRVEIEQACRREGRGVHP